MSLIACKNCGKNVSDLAETCPHCGKKIKGDIKMYSETIYNLFTEALTNRLDFNFEEDKEEGSNSCLSLPSRIGGCSDSALR